MDSPACHNVSHKKATVRELRLQTSAIVRLAADGETFVIQTGRIVLAEPEPVGRLGAQRAWRIGTMHSPRVESLRTTTSAGARYQPYRVI